MKGKADDQLAYPQASSKGWSPESGLRDRPKSTRLAQPLKAIIFATLDRDLSGLLNQTELLTVLTTSRCDVDAPPESAVDPGRQVSEYGYKMRNEGCLPWRVSNARAEIPDIDMDSSRSIDFVEFSLAMDNMDDERFLPEVRRHGFFDCNSVHIGTLFSNLPQQVGREWCAHFWRVLTDPTTACAACDMTNAGGVYNTGVTNGGCRMCIIHAQTLKFWHAQFLSAQVASRGHSSVSSVSLSDADPSSAPSSSLLTFFFSAATSISTTARDAVISAAACLASVVARLHDIIVFGLFGPYGRLLSFLGLVMLLMLLGIALVFRRALIGRRVSTTPSRSPWPWLQVGRLPMSPPLATARSVLSALTLRPHMQRYRAAISVCAVHVRARSWQVGSAQSAGSQSSARCGYMVPGIDDQQLHLRGNHLRP